MEHRAGGGREEPDVQVTVEEDRRNIGAVEHVLQVVRRRAVALDGFLQLGVQRRQLLVEGLQLLLRGEQFLVGGLELLVDRQRLGGIGGVALDLLFQFAQGIAEIVAGRLQIGLELGDARCGIRRPVPIGR